MKTYVKPFQISAFIYVVQKGFVTFHFMQLEAQYYGTNGWLAVFLGFALTCVNLWLIGAVYRMGKGESILHILERSIPKVLLYPLYTGLVLVWIILGCLEGKRYVLTFAMVAFPAANPMLFKLVFDFLLIYMLTKGIHNIIKAGSVFFWLTVWMPALLMFLIPEFSWARLTPFLFKEGESFWQGIPSMYTLFIGFELCLLLFPYVTPEARLIRSVFIGNLISLCAYVALSFMAFGVFSLNQLKQLVYPLMNMIAYVQLPFVERMENVLYGFFLFISLSAAVFYIWAAREVCERMLPRVPSRWLGAGLLVIAYIIAIIPNSISDVREWLEMLGLIETGIAFGLPLLLILLLAVRRKESPSHA